VAAPARGGTLTSERFLAAPTSSSVACERTPDPRSTSNPKGILVRGHAGLAGDLSAWSSWSCN